MSYIGTPFADNTNLLNTTVSTVSIGTGIDVSGFSTLLIQVSGSTFNGIITFERSLDNVYWSPALVTELNALNQKTQIETAGLYFVRTEAQFIRYNVTNISGSATIVIDGSQNVVSNADKVAWAMDETNNTPLNVKLQVQNSGIKQDLSGAFILSDAPTTQTISATVGAITFIDTTGYQSIQISTNATYGASISNSNDGFTFQTAAFATANGTYSVSLSPATNYTIPVTAKIYKLTCNTAGQFTYVLRNTAPTFVHQNLASISGASVAPSSAQLGINLVNIGGNAVVTAGNAGTLAVGGGGQPGVTLTTNPVVIGAIDPANLIRQAVSTGLGDLITGNRTIPTNLAALGTTTTGKTPIAATGYNNQIPHTIQDTSQLEGQSQIELLAQILLELKIFNHQMYELPRVISLALQGPTAPQQGQSIQLGDEPYNLRQDSSLFINQQ